MSAFLEVAGALSPINSWQSRDGEQNNIQVGTNVVVFEIGSAE